MKGHSGSTFFIGGLVFVALLASSAPAWVPKLLSFLGTNGDLIQALADFIQILLWVIAAFLLLQKLSSRKSPKPHSPPQNSTTEKKSRARQSQSSSKNSTSYSVNADRITGFVQGEHNVVDFHFDDSSSSTED